MVKGKTKKKNGLEIYKSKGEFRWRVYRQGRVIAASSEGYKRMIGLARNVISTCVTLLYTDINKTVEKTKESLK